MLIYLLACGPKLPSALQNSIPNLPNCNDKEYLYAKGIGSTPEASIESARKSISEQIVSNISSQSEMMTEYIAKARSFNGKVEDNTTEIETFNSNVQINSSFAHMELIKTVIEPTQSNGQFYSLACLNKKETSQVISNKLEPKIKKFQTYTKQALQKYEGGDIPSFSINYHKAMELRAEIASELYVIRSATNTRSFLEPSFRESWEKLEETADMIRNDIVIGIHLANTIQFHEITEKTTKTFTEPNLFVRAFSKELENNALLVRSTDTCQVGLTHFITLHVETNCPPTLNPIGQVQCFVIYKANLKDCATDANLNITLEGKRLSGIHRYTSEEALRNAAHTKNLGPIMQEEMRNYFPIIPLSQ